MGTDAPTGPEAGVTGGKSAPPADAHLRLKRVFLRTLVISLATCAFVAVAALLIGEFTELTGKILFTLGALALHSGMAIACTDSLEKRRWPKLSITGLVLFGLNFCTLMTCLWGTGFNQPWERAMFTTGALLGYYILAIPAASLHEGQRLRSLALAGLAVCTVGFAMLLVCIWSEPTGSDAFPKATAIAAIIAFALTHTCLVVRVPGGIGLPWLLFGTCASMWTLAAVASGMIILEPQHEFWARLLGALGVIAATGSLALLILTKLRRVGKEERLETTPARVELRCPRCTTLQTVNAGATRCAACGLKFRIEIEEPRCPKCDYLLWQLPERRCPECGTTF